MKNTKLHTVLSFIMLTALLLVLFGCNASETPDGSSPESSNSRFDNSTENTLTTTETTTISTATNTTETRTTTTAITTTTTNTSTTTTATTTTATTTTTSTRKTTTATTTTTNAQEKRYRVVCAQEDGIVIDWGDGIYIFVKLDNADFKITSLKTVVMVFSKSDLIPADGVFRNFNGDNLHYSYILENLKSIRLAAAGEPTFG